MGAPSQDNPDRSAAPNAEVPVDEGWTASVLSYNDQTTADLSVGPASVGGIHPSNDPEHTNGPRGLNPTGLAEGTDQILTELKRDQADADAEGTDQILAELKRDQAVADAEGTGQVLAELKRDLADSEQTATDAAVMLPEPAHDAVRDEHVLSQPEREPLDLVLRELEPAPPKQTSTSDDSGFVASLIGEQPSQRGETPYPAITAMEPVLHRPRKRARIAAGALAATLALGAAGAMIMTRGHKAPQAAASEVAKVNATPTVAPTPSNVVTPTAPPANQLPAPSAPSNAPAVEAPPGPSAEPTPPSNVANVTAAAPATTPSEPPQKPDKTRSTSSKHATAKKTVALKDPTAKKPLAAKTTAKKPAKKTTPAKKSLTAKKPTTNK
jgi:hypothetical protein